MTTKKELDKLIQDYLSVMGYSSTLDTFSKEKIKSHGNVQFTLLAQQLGEYGDSRTKNGSNAVACLQKILDENRSMKEVLQRSEHDGRSIQCTRVTPPKTNFETRFGERSSSSTQHTKSFADCLSTPKRKRLEDRLHGKSEKKTRMSHHKEPQQEPIHSVKRETIPSNDQSFLEAIDIDKCLDFIKYD